MSVEKGMVIYYMSPSQIMISILAAISALTESESDRDAVGQFCSNRVAEIKKLLLTQTTTLHPSEKINSTRT